MLREHYHLIVLKRQNHTEPRAWPRLRRPPAAARVATIRSLVVVSGLGTWISVSAYSEANIPGDSTVQLKSVDGYVSKALTKCLHYEN